MALFSAGTLIAALAPGFAVLLAARVVQAGGTAIMMPLLMTTVMTLVPPARRGEMMGNISIVISVAPAIGPTVSGLVLSVLGWRSMFWLVLPIASPRWCWGCAGSSTSASRATRRSTCCPSCCRCSASVAWCTG